MDYMKSFEILLRFACCVLKVMLSPVAFCLLCVESDVKKYYPFIKKTGIKWLVQLSYKIYTSKYTKYILVNIQNGWYSSRTKYILVNIQNIS